MIFPRALLLCVLLSSASWLLADDFWQQPFDTWKREQVVRMLNDSPWAQIETFTAPIVSKDAGLAGEKELYYRFTARFFSARPVREAYVRMARLMNNYDQMAPDQRQEFDKRFQRALNLDVADRVIVAVEYATNDPNTSRDLRPAFELATAETLKQRVYLISQRLGRVELLEYFPPSADGTGAKFVFPRTVHGQPIFGPQDKEIRFDFTTPVTNHRIFLTFKSAKMVYRGELSY
ncbi:MAG: hypothetical protein DMG58_00835 [Acidobacteria bacterium]|jgi:hypothetical protein|nr:MAG: hypothetical protein DMG58_00835 [Acidobacteriota bacterium]PYT45006.1 MAG: hypothetical protein DMG47_09385 [Acidobacteriota bacterium]